MRKEDLLNIGVAEENVAKIIELAKADLEGFVPKARLDEVIKDRDALKTQIADRDKQLEELKKIDAAGLQAEIERLQTENTATKEQYETEISKMKLDSAIRDTLRTAEARDIDMALKLLDLSEVEFDKKGNLTGLDEQIAALKENEFGKNLFGKEQVNPAGTNPAGNPTPAVTKKPSEMSYAELDAFMRANPGIDLSSLE